MIHSRLKGGWESVREINRLIPTYGSVEGDWKWEKGEKGHAKQGALSVSSLPANKLKNMSWRIYHLNGMTFN